MTKLAILSDIHGNYDAFIQVLDDIEEQRVDQMVCLGDCIGYGPEPEKVISEIRSRNLSTIMGNHELALFDKKQLNGFNPLAEESLRKTRRMLSIDSLNFIARLPSSVVVAGARCVHGYPPDLTCTYLFQKSKQALRETFETLEEHICFIGHTHFLDLVRFNEQQQIDHLPLERGITMLDANHKYFINIGSVGQPRDNNNNAKYVIWEPDNNRVEVRFVPYDIANVVAKIKAAGLPEAHGRRLW